MTRRLRKHFVKWKKIENKKLNEIVHNFRKRLRKALTRILKQRMNIEKNVEINEQKYDKFMAEEYN